MAQTLRKLNWLLILAAFPFLLSIGVHAWGVVPHESPAPAKITPLVFDYYSYKNRLRLGDRPVGHYVFRNRSSQPVTLHSIAPSCDCVHLSLFDAKQGRKSLDSLTHDDRLPIENVTIEPGMMCILFAQMDTTSKEAGLNEYDIHLRYHAGSEPESNTLSQDLKFALILPQAKMEVHPKTGVFHITNNKKQDKSFWVVDHRGNDFEVSNLKSNSKYLDAKLGQVELDPAVGKKQEIILSTNDNIPESTQKFFVTFDTNDPEFATMKIGVMLSTSSGNVKRFKQSEDFFYFAVEQGKSEPVTRTMTLTNLSLEELNITDVSTSSEMLTAKIVETQKVKAKLASAQEADKLVTQYTLEATLTPEFEKADNYRYLVTLKTDHSRWPEITIPVKINCFTEEETDSQDSTKPSASNETP